LRTKTQIPIIVLSVRGEERTKVQALDAGADDYVTKPFSIQELLARVRAHLRRAPERTTAAIEVGDFVVDSQAHSIAVQGKLIHLTPKEFELTHHLMTHAGRPIQHSRLLNTVWGEGYGNELEYLRTFMRQLRKKLEDDPANPKYLLTEAHVGYRFAENS